MPTNNSSGNSGGGAAGKPHRRVLLTQPSAVGDAALPQAPLGAPPASAPSGSGDTGEASASLVRVIAYLTPEETQELEQTWLQMRALAIRPSKADIMRAALKMAMANPDALRAALGAQMDGGK